MSDVILQAAIKANLAVTNERLASSGTSTIKESFYTCPQTTGYPYVGGGSGTGYNPQCPTIVQNWKSVLTPLIQTGSTGIKVCDNSGYYRCDRSCNFTVPSGVTRVQFQLWGPGGGTSGQCCCGGSPFGPSGAYTAVRLNVTAGEIYCICTGCAYCCYANQTTPGAQGSNTWICGPGLSTCADSGNSCYCYWNQDLGSTSSGTSIPAYPAGSTTTGSDTCSAHQCSGWNFCWDTAADNTVVCHAFSRATWKYNCASTTRNLVCYGLNGLWPHMTIGPSELDTGTCSVAAPVFGYENCTCQTSWNGNTCRGCCQKAENGYMQIPGAGGWADRKHGGCDGEGGDSGKMGMVCISYGGIT